MIHCVRGRKDAAAFASAYFHCANKIGPSKRFLMRYFGESDLRSGFLARCMAAFLAHLFRIGLLF